MLQWLSFSSGPGQSFPHGTFIGFFSLVFFSSALLGLLRASCHPQDVRNRWLVLAGWWCKWSSRSPRTSSGRFYSSNRQTSQFQFLLLIFKIRPTSYRVAAALPCRVIVAVVVVLRRSRSLTVSARTGRPTSGNGKKRILSRHISTSVHQIGFFFSVS